MDNSVLEDDDVAMISFSSNGSVGFSLLNEASYGDYECYAAYVAYRALLEDSNTEFFNSEAKRLNLEKDFHNFLEEGDEAPATRSPAQLTLV